MNSPLTPLLEREGNKRGELAEMGRKPCASDTIKGFELTPIPPLLAREGDQGGEFGLSIIHLPSRLHRKLKDGKEQPKLRTCFLHWQELCGTRSGAVKHYT